MKLLREPLVHFLFIGAAIYLAFGLFAEPLEDVHDNTLVVDAGEIEWMATSWYKRWNRMPTPQELEGLIQQYIRETVLYREALAAQRAAGPPTRATATTMNNLAVLLSDTGRFDEAEELHRQTLDLRLEQFGEVAASRPNPGRVGVF